MTRTFNDTEAVRERTPLLVGLVGPSGSGKTFSALRLATGIQRVAGGEIFVIDTEARRSLHYAKRFKFRHVAFGAPFSPLDYLAAIEHCTKKGASTIIVDSLSHEHEGPGGVLEMHAEEHKRLGGEEKTKLMAWSKPKQARRRLINTVLQLPINVIFCFRAKEKIKPEGRQMLHLGYQAIGGEEFVFEMTQNILLLPGANGVPTLRSEMIGERELIKVPDQFRHLFPVERPPQLTEDLGAELATWAIGDAAPAPVQLGDLVAGYQACSDPATFRQLEQMRGSIWKSLSKADQAAAKAASTAAEKRLAEVAADPPPVAPPAQAEEPPAAA